MHRLGLPVFLVSAATTTYLLICHHLGPGVVGIQNTLTQECVSVIFAGLALIGSVLVFGAIGPRALRIGSWCLALSALVFLVHVGRELAPKTPRQESVGETRAAPKPVIPVYSMTAYPGKWTEPILAPKGYHFIGQPDGPVLIRLFGKDGKWSRETTYIPGRSSAYQGDFTLIMYQAPAGSRPVNIRYYFEPGGGR